MQGKTYISNRMFSAPSRRPAVGLEALGQGKSATGLILFATAFLLALSVLMVFSTTALSSREHFGNETAFLNRHLSQMLVGLLVCVAMSRVPVDVLRKCAPAFLVASAIMLLLTLVPGIGSRAGGAVRWLSLGPLRFQPGEIAKLSIVLYMATFIGRHSDAMSTFSKGIVTPLAITAVFACLFLLQPDFGSTSIVLIVVFCQLLLASRFLHLSSVGVVAVCALGVLIAVSPYRLRRFETFLDPFRDPSATGYQLVQSLIAVGSGGIGGEGLGAGKQKLFYLPAAHTDFIFAVIAEELGFLGACGVIALFLLLGAGGFAVARKHLDDPFRASLAVGLTALLVVPAMLNIAVVSGMLPTKGLVLPLVAYGGTAMAVNLAVVGILLSLSRERPL